MRVALDVDGVLADFVGLTLMWIRSQLGIRLTHADVKTWEIQDLLPAEIRPLLLNAWRSEHFCALIPVIGDPRLGKTLQELRSRHAVKCVTTPMDASLFWKSERAAWLKNIFGFAYEDIVFSGRKHEHVNDFDVLVDDNVENVENWLAAGGKEAILIDQPWNRHRRVHRRVDGLWHASVVIDSLEPR